MADEQVPDESDEAIEEEGKKLQAEADKADAESEKNVEEGQGEEAEAEAEAEADADEEAKGEQEYEDTDSPDIPVRSSASQIIARQKRTIEKLRSKVSEEDVEEDEDESLTDESLGAVQKEIQRQVAPLIDSLVTRADEEELQDLFTKEPGAKSYEKTIRAYMKHDNYRGVPPSFIYKALSFENAKSTGAREKEAADLEAKQMSGAGSTSRPSERPTGDLPTAEEIEDMSDEEFEKLEHKARTGKFV